MYVSSNNINHWIPGSILATVCRAIIIQNQVSQWCSDYVDHVKARYSRDQSFLVPASIPQLEIVARNQD